MITDEQYRRLMRMSGQMARYRAADKAGMSEKTARKYSRGGKPPSEVCQQHHWRTRKDPFTEVWSEVKGMLAVNPGLEAKTLLGYLQANGKWEFKEGQLRTLQRRVRTWRATEGPGKEVMFDQVHRPGELSASDFTDMTELGVTIRCELFHHLTYHFVLTYSNWEHAKVCFSESFEAFSEGFQESLWALGGVPKRHRTDQMSAAVQKIDGGKKAFTDRYQALLRHYGITGEKIQAGVAHENGDSEQSHHRFKRAVKQALLLRSSSDFETRSAYEGFLKQGVSQLNTGRKEKFQQDMAQLRVLPLTTVDSVKQVQVRVRPSSTITVERNTYSVPSQLIGERVDVRLYSDRLEVWYAQSKREEFPRFIGRGKHRIEYRHIIDSLIRKPGAFSQYRYREELFPTARFRAAYDGLIHHSPARAEKAYLAILNLAAKGSQRRVDDALQWLLDHKLPFELDFVEDLVRHADTLPAMSDVQIPAVEVSAYDALLELAL